MPDVVITSYLSNSVIIRFVRSYSDFFIIPPKTVSVNFAHQGRYISRPHPSLSVGLCVEAALTSVGADRIRYAHLGKPLLQ